MQDLNTLEMLYERLGDLNTMISNYEGEIEYLEELLTTTSGSAQPVIDDLEKNKARRNELQSEYSQVLKLINDEKNKGVQQV